jgi:hypothetical protein
MKTMKLWTGKTIDPKALPFPEQLTHVQVHRSAPPYEFLLGADIIDFNGELFCGWGASRKDENDRFSVMNGAVSKDGLHWDSFMRISPLARGKKAYSHGVFHIENGVLCSYLPTASYNISEYPDLQTIKMIWNADQRSWEYAGVVIPEHFWPMSRPVANHAGTWLMPGLMLDKRGALPAVAIREPGSPEKWEISIVPVPGNKNVWGEGGLLIRGKEVLYIFRNGWDQKRVCCAALSTDGGHTWGKACRTNFLASLAKLCCGTLPDGRNYILCNLPAEGMDERDTLAIALSEPGQWEFNRAWALRRGPSPLARTKGAGKTPQWAYPLACVKDNILHVVYAVTKEDCAATLLPLDILR